MASSLPAEKPSLGARAPRGLLLVALAWLCAPWCCAEGRAADPEKATTSRQAREEAIRELPTNRLDQNDRDLVDSVLANTSLYRRMPTQVIDCDPHLYLFLLQHPEVIVNIWEVLGVSGVSLDRTGEKTFRAADGEGTLGTVKVLHSEFDKQVIYAEGAYEGPLFNRPVRARCVMMLRSRYIRETNGRYYVTCRLDTFVHLDRTSIELLAKTFQPLFARSADHNFAETMSFVASLSRAAESNPAGTVRIARKLTKVDPAARDRLVELTHAVALRTLKEEKQREEQYEAMVKRNQTQLGPM